MIIKTFMEEYDLHDSLLEKFQFDGVNLILEIDLCNWRQKNYNSEENEMKEIKVTFKNVQNFHLDSTNDEIDMDSILEISYTNGDASSNLKDIKFVFEGDGDIKIMTFTSDNVVVE